MYIVRCDRVDRNVIGSSSCQTNETNKRDDLEAERAKLAQHALIAVPARIRCASVVGRRRGRRARERAMRVVCIEIRNVAVSGSRSRGSIVTKSNIVRRMGRVLHAGLIRTERSSS